MASSLAIIILLGLIANKLFEKLKLPGLLGMLILGILIGPHGLNWLSKDILNASADLRKIALIVILLRAGLGLNKEELKLVGKTALKLSCIPGIIEGLFIAIASVKLLGFSFVQGGLLGFIIAAVSPAVVVPQMLNLIDKGLGKAKGIPTLILAGASIDDVFAITIFSTFLGLYAGKNINIAIQILKIPVSIILGTLIGVLSAIIIIKIFKKYPIDNTKKILIILSISIILTLIEALLKGKLEIASLLGVMALGFVISDKIPSIGDKVSKGLNEIWVFAQILLFVLVGAEVNMVIAFKSGFLGIIIIALGLIGRSIGVLISLKGSNLNKEEKLFCIIAYIPKATVQAAMGAVPLANGVAAGDIILAIAVLSILTTAPLGAIAINLSGPRLLESNLS
ncbi:cation:proton antiporter domain-containing protein [Clostridium botulinum]|uniref:Na(+)/H(+) antiporter n=1 Tax=Clostridium botulinum (strain Hall / ATCC 3502 / NCTC 13319 / Type A) TaxID=441771 RepID=A5I2X3_CLOBH|nr:cation:proton antiporter [Clostridium botulinum]EPS46465.1 monovalent cation:proton antiporter-2 (CPA2) family protein [Clostridium botulinum CFSAN002369]EPS49854.1 monovalent cation:proton antiporter-2 (CPA2) family protein [Clostridium botulinum CFSAN002367]ABS33452.1 transporter, monovalent cation:proton antiporter-2 (CPA2) family [Clostridium botulinum A str. ATCC 19397]ABS38762.1 transporter, monovalent cation:proton antiporter-2 (CPA2) family [Clostridium botulinum A str. Hall]AWB1772